MCHNAVPCRVLSADLYSCNKKIQLGLMFMDASYQFNSSPVQNKIVVERNLNFKLTTAVLIIKSMLGMLCSEM